MRKLILILPALAMVLVLAKWTSVRIAHDNAARSLLQTISKLPLPERAQIVEERYEVGGFISGTGNDIDVMAYRVFRSELPEGEVQQFFVEHVPEKMRGDLVCGVFRLDKPEPPDSHGPEYFLRLMALPRKTGTYVFYAADRIDDGTWDWRGW